MIGGVFLSDKEKRMQEIVQFVTRNKWSYASHAVCSRVLGGEFYGIDQQVIDELKTKLPEIDSDEIEACYYIIK